MDMLDRLYTAHQDFFDWLDFVMETLPELPEDWQDQLVEPDDEFLAQSDRNANDLLLDILGVE